MIDKLKAIPFHIRMMSLGILLAELLSFFAWMKPEIGSICFIAILLITAYVSLKDLKYGIGIWLAELIIASQGYLFSLEIGGLGLSLRIGIFLILFAVAIAKSISEKKVRFLSSGQLWYLVTLTLIVFLGMANGIYSGNGWGNVFFDSNGYFFIGAAFFLWQGIKTKQDLKFLAEIAIVALLASVIKVMFIMYSFSHKFWWMMPETYRWIRDTRVGEVTLMTPDANIHVYRIFFQSQIYAVFAFFIAWLASLESKASSIKVLSKTKSFYFLLSFLILLFSTIVISLSRSFWVGMAAAGLCLPVLLWKFIDNPVQSLGRLITVAIPTLIGSILLITIVVLFPFPLQSGSFSAGSLISKRFQSDDAVSSRWKLLPELEKAIAARPLIGHGFGKKVTYFTDDPRIVAQTGTGEYATYAFEWGYHDFIVKLGFAGLIAILAWILSIGQLLYKAISHSSEQKLKLIGLSLGYLSLIVMHFFTPFLNHPLGLSFLLLTALVIEVLHPSVASRS